LIKLELQDTQYVRLKSGEIAADDQTVRTL